MTTEKTMSGYEECTHHDLMHDSDKNCPECDKAFEARVTARMRTHIEKAMELMRDSGADQREYVVYATLAAALDPS
jgi:hypothetical protein